MLDSSDAPAVLPNPLRDGLAEERVPEPALMVIFGASGDLTRRKLLPALYSLTRDRLLPSRFAIVGFARKPMSDEAFRDEMRGAVDESRAAVPSTRRCGPPSPGTSSTSRAPTTIRPPSPPEDPPRGDRTHLGAAGEPGFLSFDAALVVRRRGARPRSGRLGPAAGRACKTVRPRDHRKALRH